MGTIVTIPSGVGKMGRLDAHRLLPPPERQSADAPEIDIKKRLKEELQAAERDYFDVVAFAHADAASRLCRASAAATPLLRVWAQRGASAAAAYRQEGPSNPAQIVEELTKTGQTLYSLVVEVNATPPIYHRYLRAAYKSS